MEKPKYNLYLASGITIWKEHFKPKYSDYFNNKLNLFEPGTLKIPDKHDLIPISVALKCIDKIDHSNGILVFMENYKTLDGSPTGTDSAWEVGYGVAKQKPVILFIDDKSSFDYYSLQWMVTFSVGAIITTDPEVLEILTTNHKFANHTVIFARSKNEIESKLIEYMDEYIILRDQEDKTTKLIETAVSVFIKNKKLLMDKRLPSKAIYPGLLMCPSGLMQEEELFEDSIKRRMKEELGITVEKSEYLFSIPDTDPISRKKFSHNFIVINKYLGEIKKSKEAEDLQWLTYDQLKEQKLVPIVEKLVDSLRRMNYF